MTRSEILAKVERNPVSRRYIIQVTLFADRWQKAVWDQRTREFVPDEEIERIDPDELMRLP